MEQVPEYFIYKYIFQGYDLNLTGKNLEEFVIKSTGCTQDEFLEVLNQIMDAWIK